ncbi:MAG: sugar ABC transporter permease [Anaerolineae bacterium]|nr:sugar ABC transporter permease [Anaerolineae bacterium]
MSQEQADIKQGFRTKMFTPFWLILPSLLILFLIQVYPTLYTIVLSFQDRFPTGWEFVGLANFKQLAGSSLFQKGIGHTIIFLIGYVFLTTVFGFITALLLNTEIHYKGVYITLLFIPWVIAQIIAGMVFRLLFLPDYGLLSGIMQNPSIFPPNGISVLTATAPQSWFGNFPFPPSPAMYLLILASTWRALPFVMLLMLAAMQMIPRDIMESASIDGANGWQAIRFVLIPLMLPSMVVAIFNLILTGMNSVGIIFSLTGGGPGTSTSLLSFALYTIGWGQLRFGRAAALSMILALVNWLMIMATLRITRVEERSSQHV